MKRKFLILSVLALCFSLFAAETIAYFTADSKAHNVITSGEIAIELQEWANEEKTTPFPKDGVSGVMPGTEVTKIVEVKNTGDNDAYIRVKVEKEIVLPDGVEGEPDSSLMKIDFDKTYWEKGEDGYYYYKEALKPGAVTEPLFASVNFDPAMGNIYQNSTAKVDVYAYAVQAANNPIPDGGNVTDVSGWPAAITN